MISKAILISILLTLLVFHPPTSTKPQTPVAFPSPQVEFVVGPQVKVGTDPLAAWYDEAALRRGRYWAENFLALTTVLNESNQYDLPYCLYILYYRTGDVTYRDYARRVAEKWWNSDYVQQGGPVPGGSIPNPRQAGLLGLTLWAMDVNHPNVWGYLDRITREWMDVRLLAKLSSPDIYTDPREEGCILLSAIALHRTLPDSFSQIVWDNQLNVSTKQVTDGAARRAAYLADAERVAVEYFGRLQYPDGSWRWRMWNPEPTLKAIIDRLSPTLGDKIEQPFMIGIYMEAAVRLHQITQNPTVKASLQAQITKHCDHITRDVYKTEVVAGRTSIPRVLLYFYPLEFNENAPDGSSGSDRHLTTSVIHTFGYAYRITGDAKYKVFGDELWDSCFAVTPRDGFRSLLDEPYWLKLFTAETRSSGSYLVWRMASMVPSPTPTPSVTPSPLPTPTATPTPLPSPTVTPSPTACEMTVNNPVVSQWGSGKLVVTFTGLTQSGTVRASATSGQVSVDSTPKQINGTSVIAEFWLQAKKKSSVITVSGPCGSKSVMVIVQ